MNLALNQKELHELRFLIAGSEKHFVSNIRQALIGLKIKLISEAENSEKALNELKIRLPDVMIIGWDLSPTNGASLCHFIRRHPQSPGKYLPIIMAHKFSSPDQIAKARDAGINEFLVIPFSVSALQSRIKAVIEHPRPFVDNPSYFGPDRRRKNDPNYSGPERRKTSKGLTPEQIQALLGGKK